LNLNNYTYYYFLGIGGIGMSAIARYLKSMGCQVLGYDRVRTELCIELEKEGMEINYIDQVGSIPSVIKLPKLVAGPILIIYTPAIPADSQQFNYFKNNSYTLYKRSQILGLITEDSYNISVAGTHGKTTTSSLISHLLNYANKPFGAFLGGISTNLGSNYFNTNSPGNEAITVTEADEFDRSFLTLSPNLAVVTSMDADHLDIYGTGDELKKSFFDFINKIEPGGSLFIRQGLEFPERNDIAIKTYGLNHGDFKAINIRVENGWFVFDFEGNGNIQSGLKLGIPGTHNIENAVAAIAICLQLEIPFETIADGLTAFKGVKRRFEFISRTDDFVFIDDYAHHPAELEAFIKSVRLLFPDQKLCGVFQPHLYSRTKDFAPEFAKSLSLLDTAILLDIYPARELPMPGVTSEIIFKDITADQKYLCSKETLIQTVKHINPNVFLTMGAGDIDALVLPLNDALKP
jgi:UDP-N-acetylmuramate--alanine ligase